MSQGTRDLSLYAVREGFKYRAGVWRFCLPSCGSAECQFTEVIAGSISLSVVVSERSQEARLRTFQADKELSSQHSTEAVEWPKEGFRRIVRLHGGLGTKILEHLRRVFDKTLCVMGIRRIFRIHRTYYTHARTWQICGLVLRRDLNYFLRVAKVDDTYECWSSHLQSAQQSCPLYLPLVRKGQAAAKSCTRVTTTLDASKRKWVPFEELATHGHMNGPQRRILDALIIFRMSNACVHGMHFNSDRALRSSEKQSFTCLCPCCGGCHVRQHCVPATIFCDRKPSTLTCAMTSARTEALCCTTFFESTLSVDFLKSSTPLPPSDVLPR